MWCEAGVRDGDGNRMLYADGCALRQLAMWVEVAGNVRAPPSRTAERVPAEGECNVSSHPLRHRFSKCRLQVKTGSQVAANTDKGSMSIAKMFEPVAGITIPSPFPHAHHLSFELCHSLSSSE